MFAVETYAAVHLMGEQAGSSKAFAEKLEKREGVEKTKIGHAKAKGIRGIRVVTAGVEDQERRDEDRGYR